MSGALAAHLTGLAAGQMPPAQTSGSVLPRLPTHADGEVLRVLYRSQQRPFLCQCMFAVVPHQHQLLQQGGLCWFHRHVSLKSRCVAAADGGGGWCLTSTTNWWLTGAGDAPTGRTGIACGLVS